MSFTVRDLNDLVNVLAMRGGPIYGPILALCTKKLSTDIPTAGVMWHGGKFHLICNPEFMAGLTVREQKGVLKHEAMHLIMEHCTTRRVEDPRHHQIDNYAADLAINSLLVMQNRLTSNEADWPEFTDLPRMCLMPGWRLHVEPDVMAKWDDERKAQFKKMSDFIETLPPRMSREWYLEKLMEDEEIADMLTQPSLAELLEELGIQLDDHGGWGKDGDGGTLSGEELASASGKVKEALERVAREANQRGWGDTPAEIQSYILELLKPEVDWRKQLRNWVGMTRRGNRTTSWRRPNKRLPGMMPQSVRSWTAHIAFYIDESGSVSDGEIAEGFTELAGLTRHRAIDALPFDTEVHDDRKQEIKKGGRFEARRDLAGGTCFTAVMDHAREHRKEYDGIIIFTDGYAPDPGPPRRGQRRCWLISSGGKMTFDPHPGDTVIKLDGINNPKNK
jgi:predicted metal-dependent peptidase